ncbi:hypothetical protein lerEdw1_013432 [Lerista edwardsae]|nr:hypothetical protein lerEdw1_013433 [Lerista edwardsae]KAJ6650287.1 hypothetical protein lerEdw1_013432 [Lerista edwardsae]
MYPSHEHQNTLRGKANSVVLAFLFAAVHDAYGVISKVSDDKIDVSHLNDALAAIGIVLTTEEMREALKNVTVDSDGRVNLKEFMNGLPQTKRFSFTSGKYRAAIMLEEHFILNPAFACFMVSPLVCAEMEEAINNLKSIKQDKVNLEELDSILRSMGLHLTPQEIQDMLKLVPKNDDGTVSVRDCMFALTKTRRYSQSEKDKISIQNLGSILENMGIDLTKEQMQEALRRIAIDANGKVNLNDFMKVLRGMQHPSFLQGDVVSVGDVESLLSGMGINLTQEELEETLKHLTVDENGKVNMSELMKSVTKTRRLLEAERKMIAIEDLNSTLAKMGIHLTEKEMMEALKHVTFDADGRVNLKKVLERVLATRRPSKFERDRVDIEDVHEILAGLGISLTEEEMREALKRAPLDAEGKMNLGEFMKAVRIVQSQPPTGEMVEIRNLDSTLAKMGIHLTEKEMMEALKHATIDVDGRVNLKEVLESILATRRPSKFENLDEGNGNKVPGKVRDYVCL